MGKKAIITISFNVILLTLIMFFSFTIASVVSGVSKAPTGAEAPSVDARESLIALLVACLLETAVLTYVILRSRWTGWKLAGAVFLAYYGLSTVVAQIDSIIYLPRHLPPGFVTKIFIMGAITAALFSPLAVLILGKMRREFIPPEPNRQLAMPPGEWAWKLAVIAVAFAIVYFTFGYFVAWKNPAVQKYYGGTDAGNFFAQMAWIGEKTPWMFALQAFRGVLWAAFALPVIRMLKGRPWEVALATALLFAVWSSMLLLPNPYMPAEIRKMHLIETASEDFIFGWLVGWLLCRHHWSLRDLFGWSEGR